MTVFEEFLQWFRHRSDKEAVEKKRREEKGQVRMREGQVTDWQTPRSDGLFMPYSLLVYGIIYRNCVLHGVFSQCILYDNCSAMPAKTPY